ncbi:MAG TPA: kelch repeat-containing protein [Polyangia bacterium]|nr:kelch repeat-containing protein [Polyangia bacterium]
MTPEETILTTVPRRLLPILLAATAGCVEAPASSGPGATHARLADPPDAAAVTIRSAAATAPASWVNHWGSWPLARFEHAMSYDVDRHLTVMFAGRPSATALFGDTWEWDGERTQWVQRTPAVESNGPPARAGHAMVYDAARQRTFLFGGWQPGSGQFPADQWEWNSGDKTWHERAISGTAPAPRYGHAMIYDPDRGRVVLFGGYGGTGSAKARLNDLWEWDGSSWTDTTPAGSKPSPRLNALMAYDASRKVIVLRGGNTGTAAPPSGTAIDDNWEWDATTATWSPRTAPPLTGTSLSTHRAVYDAGLRKVILYQDYQNVWQWDADTPAWVPLTTSKTDPLLPPTSAPGIIYDAGRARVTLFGGLVGRTRDVWELNPADGSWLSRSPPIDGPTPRTWPFLAIDSLRDALMVFGGFHSGDASPYKQDIWQWTPALPDWDNSITKLTGAKPSVRAYGPMVYDPIQDRLMVFGGYGGGIYLNDVWAWSPSTQAWTALQPTGPLPGARSNHWAFHDRRRNKLVAFGGYAAANGQIWELDLTALTWANWTPSPNPVEITGRADYDVALDPDRGKLVLIGGATAGVTDAAVWEWDLAAHSWAPRIPPAGGPPVMPGRSLHAIAYDSDRRVVIVVGGRSAANMLLDDSWEWDGNRAAWSETTPPTMRPLPRTGHRLLYDEKRGTALLYGGSVTQDATYGDREIWEYVPNRAPRPDGAPCSVAAAAACSSGFCVDGVCCQAPSCAGACRACNVAGQEGTCADVPAGGADDACQSEQACDAAHQCKTGKGQACGTFSDCASGHCADGVCCDSDCNQACYACNLSNSRGVCSPVSQGFEDPVGAPACASDAAQGRACDGQGRCAQGSKASGDLCTAAAQCGSGFCIDGVCCNNACAGTCQACNLTASTGTCTAVPLGQQDPSATTPCAGPMQYCSAGTCAQNKKPNGGSCAGAAECGSGFCADGVCCDGACTATCQACNLPGLVGRCAPVPAGATDTSATTACATPQYCNGAGGCAAGSRSNGVRCGQGGDCASGHCSDGVCCDGPCTGACRTCNLPGIEGTCALLPPGSTDATGTPPACAAPSYCAQGGACVTGTGRKANGATCTADSECGSSNCVDGVCCESACAGRCRSCGNATGTCVNVADGSDPRADCAGDGVCAGTCNGRGACRYPVNGLTCRDAGCQSDGYIGTAGSCDGAGRCQFGISKDCGGYVCIKDGAGMDACRSDCAGDTQCVGSHHCDPSQCLADLANGKSCDRDSQCLSGFCADGTCCDKRCGACGSCNLPGKEGTCDFTPAGTDPRNECIDSASDPSGKCGGVCNGRGACEFPAANTGCGTCKVCDGSGKCNVKPEDDPACGTVDCDQLDTSCRDYRDLQARRCASLGVCKVANLPATCTDVTDTCGPDAGAGGAPTGDGGGGAGGDATSGGDGAPADGGGGTKGAGGGCGCAVGEGDGLPSTLTVGLLAACVELLRRGRRRRR